MHDVLPTVVTKVILDTPVLRQNSVRRQVLDLSALIRRRVWTGWRQALVIVSRNTVLPWQRRRFRESWARLSARPAAGRPRVNRQIRALVVRMAQANPLWGAPRIHGELQMLGIDVAERTVSRLLPQRRSPPSQTWRSPWQNPFAERLIGSIQRECLDHVVVFGEWHLRRILSAYFAYYHRARTHLSLDKDAPDGRPIEPPALDAIIPIPEVGGLHHRYVRRAA